jgi:putative nucleotidyltransferase with HDIG domain
MKNTAIDIVQRLQKSGHQAYFVGGCVRDQIMGIEPKDYDIVTSARPDEIHAVFAEHKTINVGESFGIVTVIISGMPFEIATFRADHGNSDGRHPDAVELVTDVLADLSRRDFTMNAIAYDPIANKTIDPFKGQADILAKTVRFIGRPADRIKEDRLRILRAVRFVAQKGFSLDEKAYEAILSAASSGDPLKGVSQERITEELKKTLIADEAFDAMVVMADTGLLFNIIPALSDTLIDHDSPWHHETFREFGNSIFSHIMLVLKNAIENTKSFSAAERLNVRLAAIFHDIGKPTAKRAKDDHSTYVGHDRISATMAKKILTSMKFDNDTIREVSELCDMHMHLHDLVRAKKASFIRRTLGRSDIEQLLALGRADEDATLNSFRVKSLMASVAEHRAKFSVMLPAPLVTGYDLISMGFSPSDKFKDALKKAYDFQLTSDDYDKKRCLNFARGIMSNG